MSKMMKITIENRITLVDAPHELVKAISGHLTMPNPKWVENQRMGRWNGGTPRIMRCYELTDAGLELPRGFVRQLVSLCRQHGISPLINDKRRTLPEAELTFIGNLRPFQAQAVENMLKHDFGTLSAPTGSGKTVMALNMIAKRRQPTLVVVHTKELLHQWMDRIETFFGILRDDIGVIGAGKRTLGARVTVALVQSLYKCASAVSLQIGHLVIDECHRCPSRTFTEAVSAFDSRYMLGLSATPFRRDKLSNLIFWYLGDCHHEVDAELLVDQGDILTAEVITRKTDFRPFSDPSTDYTKMLSELTADNTRNELIAKDVAMVSSNGGGTCLVLSDRKSHCRELQKVLEQRHDTPCELLTGDVSNKRRQEIVDQVNSGEVRVLVATGQLIGEGFDCKELSTLFLCTPIRFSGRVTQYLGRVLRPAPGKDKARVYDYVDVNVGPLVAAAKARQRVYRGDQ